ncbi:bifunctional RNase H/acid phosphatase [Allosaccharopolyspora coralli]|uniref:bifunctional RNase H/acid phosphatase n=1 Tax=Allosaccharopolyspora coralli TaxID=2665642 RepID=UPI001E48E23C|nr:bifunctional RNase H/acid phosphatase [Allosaccharopolyspora coralli]
MVVEADGGSRGNPGPAGYGAVLRGDGGAVLAERSGGLGVTTNNVAEYRGMIAGLEAALEYGGTEVRVRLDSKLVVEQMCGRWKVKNETLRPMHTRATDLVNRLGAVTFEWIPRAENTHADRLANAAMDEQAGDGSAQAPNAAGAETAGSDSTASTTPASASWTGALGRPTRLILLRHGQTAMSVDRRYSGGGDVPLTDLGVRQAEAAGKRLASMDLGGVPVLCSPLQRTRRTAEAVVSQTGSELRAHEGLVETDFGAWEGLTFREAAEQYPELHRSWLGDPDVEPPGGESLNAVYERVSVACTDILARYAAETVVLVSHVTPIKALLRLGLGVGPAVFYRLHLDLASLSIVEFYPDGNASVHLVNDTAHLSATGVLE